MQISGTTSNAYSALNGSSKGISGLASGMDTQAMVEKMLSGQQTKINKQKAAKQVAQWKQNIYRDVITKIDAFQKKFFDYTSTTALHTNGFFNQMKATTSSSAFRVTGASSSAVTGEMRLKIDQLATATKLEGNALDATNQLEGSFNTDAFNTRVAFTYMQPKTDADGKVTYTEKSFVLGETEIQKLLNNENVEINVPKDPADPSAGNDTFKFNMTSGNLKIESEHQVLIGQSKLDTDATPADEKGKTSTALGLAMLGLRGGGSTTYDKEEKNYSLSTTVDKNATTSLDITLDGNKKTLTLAKDETINSFRDKIKFAFGDSAITVDGTDLSNFTLKTTAGRKIVVGGNASGLESVGFKNGQSNLVGAGDTIENALGFTFDSTGKYNLNINGVAVELEKTDTISSMMSKINKSGADVKLEYDEFQNKFSLSRKSSGDGYEIEFGSDDQGFFNKLLGADPNVLKADPTHYTEGQNAIVQINGVTTERSSNNFTLGGVSFELLAKTTTAEGDAITTTRDTEAVFNGIKSFVDEYNTMIKDLNKLIHQERDYKEYPPLTDEQKKEMSQSEIDAWEKKAQVGLLTGDSDISTFLSQLRLSIYQKPESAKFAMFDIGIETSKDTAKYGELVLNEAKLKEMLNTNISDIQELFTYSKNKTVTDADGNETEVPDGIQGISAAFKNIIKSTANISSGSPGVLVQLAGYANTGTDKKNALYDQMQDASDRIKNLTFQYEKQKTRYWNQFTAMEKALASLSAQSSWLTQQMG